MQKSFEEKFQAYQHDYKIVLDKFSAEAKKNIQALVERHQVTPGSLRERIHRLFTVNEIHLISGSSLPEYRSKLGKNKVRTVVTFWTRFFILSIVFGDQLYA